MSLLTFSQKVKTYLKAAGYTQKALANALSMEPTVLSHKLNGTGRTILNHPEVKEIIKALANLEAISKRTEAMDLLDEMNCPAFSHMEWSSNPLNKLEVGNLTGTISLYSNKPLRTAGTGKVEHDFPLSMSRANQPETRTVTFLFASIANKKAPGERHPAAMGKTLEHYYVLLEGLLKNKGGDVFKKSGTILQTAFSNPLPALEAAVATQRVLAKEGRAGAGFPENLKVRMVIHTGSADYLNGNYSGRSLALLEQLLDTGHGGQILLSLVSAELVRDQLPSGVSLRNLGEYRLKDARQPEHIFQIVAPDLPAEFPPLNSLQVLATNLPAQPTTFIGREQELTRIRKLLATNPMVTLTGPGGAGKTRLAIQVGASLVMDYKHGVWFVELASVSDPALIVQVVATVLNIREEPGRALLNTVTERLLSRQLLLILDNCEHLIEVCARFAEQLLKTCPSLKLMTTSREVFNIAGETAFLVPSLSLPAPVPPHQEAVDRELIEKDLISKLEQYEATRLFIQRAQAAKPGFEVTTRNGPAIAKICNELDGMPLAIELAASRTRMMPVEQISERLSDRFRLLTGGSRIAQRRQQTLRASIEWSYDLLDESEKKVFCRASVFSGGWTLEAAEAVCAEPDILPDDLFDLTFQLVNKSLLMNQFEEPQTANTRFNMLETLRQFALEKFEESDQDQKEKILLNHSRFYLNLLEEIQPVEEMEKEVREAWLNQVRAELDNLRCALSRALEANNLEIALRLTKGLTPFWDWEGFISEAKSYTQTVINRILRYLEEGQAKSYPFGVGGDGNDIGWFGALALLRENLGDWLKLTGHNEEALEQYNQALVSLANLQKEVVREGRLNRKMGETWFHLRDYEMALSLYHKAEEVLASMPGGSNSLSWQEWINIQIQKVGVYYERNNLLEIKEILPRLQDILNRFGSSRQKERVFPSAMLSYLYRLNRYTVSEEHLGYARTVLKSARETGKINEVAAAQFRLGFSLLWHQDFDEAEQQFLECLEVAGRIDDVILKARCLTYLSVSCRRRGQIDQTQYYLNQLEETLSALKMSEYQGVCKANQGWVQWQQGKTEQAIENLKRGLAFWSGQEGKRAPAYPFRWLALWPLISISLAINNTNQAFEYSRELLGPDQQLIPQDLKLILEQIHHNYVQGNLDETTRLLKQAVEEAKAKGYL